MGTEVRVVGGRHRRVDPETGEPEVFENGEVFEATEDELDAFGDKFEPVDGDGDGWTPDRGGPEPEGPIPGTYVLARGGQHRYGRDAEGREVILHEGDEVELSEDEVEAIGDKFDLVEPDPEWAEAHGYDDEDDADEEEAEAEAEDVDEDESDESEAEGEADEAEPEAEELPPIPDDLDALDYRGEGSLQELAMAYGIDDVQVARTDLEDFLEEQREAE